MAVVIEKGIPIPPRIYGVESKYPFAKMEVNDSILVPLPSNKIGGWIRAHIAKGKKFTIRKVEGGTRVWRIE